MIRLRTFGVVDLRGSDGSELAAILGQPKRLALLIYLAAARPGGVHRRESLLALFWPELDEARARDALNQALRFLRQSLGSQTFLRRSAEEIGVDPARLWCDVPAFRAAVGEERWDDALDLYRGDFLPGFFIGGAGGFEQWMEEARGGLRAMAARAARELARRHEADGALTLAITWGHRALEFAPDDERALRRLLGLHARAGDHAGALHLYDEFARRLETEWGSAPSPATRRLIDGLRIGRRSDGVEWPAAAHRLPGGDGRPNPTGEDGLGPLRDRYRIERELGTGGSATVYLAHDLKHDREVAVKMLHPDITGGLARDRFVREIRIAGRLQHPGIVPLLDSGEAGGRLYYVMPFLSGETLRQRLRRGSLAVADVVAVLREVAETLGYAHDQGVVHRDIKPENIMLVGSHAVVTDFGIARAVEVARTPAGRDAMTLTLPGTSLGTPTYMAPEQAAGDPKVSHLADLYSLGVLGYEMLTGRPPFVGSTPQQVLAAKLTMRPPGVLEFRPDTPAWLAGLLMQCLERDPARRPQSARSLSAELRSDPGRTRGNMSVLHLVLRRLRPMKRARAWRLAILGLAGLAASAMVPAALWRFAGPVAGTGDPNLVAVLPFRVAGSSSALEELGEGVVDLTAIYLTGEHGGLRAVEPASLFRAWRERIGTGSGGSGLADRDAIALARTLGAGWLLRGSLVGAGRDVLLRASLTPVGRRGSVVHASVTGASDSLLAHVPRLLGRILVQLAGMSADQSGSLTTTSLNAVRAYLVGQRHYRRGEYALAVDRFTEALGVDSSFALAGLWLLMAHEWSGNASQEAARAATAVTWRSRHRLRARDQALIEAVVGPNGPELSPLAEVQRARERATIVAADRFEAWYLFGDHLFHVGALLGIDEPLSLAERAFRRARDLDPGQAGVLQHLLVLAARRNDTAEVRTLWGHYQAAVPSHAVRFKEEWLVAQVLKDSALMRDALAHLDNDQAVQAGLGVLTFAVSMFPEWLPSLRRLLAQAEPTARRREQREALARLRWWLALDAGRPEEAGRILPAMGTVSLDELVLADLFWGAGSAPGPSAAARLTGAQGVCALGLAHVRDARWNGVRDAIKRLAVLARPPNPPHAPAAGRVCGLILEAAHAQGTRRPEAGRLIDAVDSMLTTVPYLELTWENLMAARLLEGEGEYRRAAAAATRFRYALGYPSYLSFYLREGARLSALAGDRERAVRSYNQYLALRQDPEAAQEPEVEVVRWELARLMGTRD